MTIIRCIIQAGLILLALYLRDSEMQCADMSALLLMGFGMQAFGQFQAGSAAKTQGRAEEAIAEFNARQAEQEGEEAQRAASEEAAAAKQRGQRLLSTQKQQFAQGGVLATGTPMAILTETLSGMEAERMRILEGGQFARRASMQQASISRFRGKAARFRGEAAYRSSILSAGGTALTGIALSQSDMFNKGTT
jgi:hypothetical protein